MKHWIANICQAAEDSLVSYARSAGLQWIAPDHIYAGLAHGSHDDPDDLETITSDVSEDQLTTIPGPNLEDLPTEDEFVKTNRAVIACKTWSAQEWDVHGECPTVRCRMSVITHSDDDKGRNHHDKAGEFFDLFCEQFAANKINSQAEDFHVYGIYQKGGGYDFDGHNWISYIELEIPCVAHTFNE